MMKLPSIPTPVLILLACIPCCLALIGLGGVATLLGGAVGATAAGLPVVGFVLAVLALAGAIALWQERSKKASRQPIEFID